MHEVMMLMRDFLDTGGSVLWLILGATILLWWLILERFSYIYRDFPQDFKSTAARWEQRRDKSSWYGNNVRKQMISELDCQLSTNMKIIPSLVALLPMLGLLGTVTGMIQVFDVLAVTGSNNPRSMADGVSAATIPTMAGMVAALTAIPVMSILDRRYKKALRDVHDTLAPQHG
ncbi:MotA/TolQ/ExbB proton channel family protein [Alteromonas aestuariivivens]|uniref:MotA/TolQ/ExbB proton channel family protein n=1 Tax=Alteromonas aestuariivivens TaxID=1938339 RepID=A0A3D8MFG4_9ALTE|nr:MotA/TolQ/ExbB proton channel family protein [Alteromonas aestuariivivens]RDV29244.1 MotA/TolQ/ExbB proton channel family protein [Alteromonas aestuariivivens]